MSQDRSGSDLSLAAAGQAHSCIMGCLSGIATKNTHHFFSLYPRPSYLNIVRLLLTFIRRKLDSHIITITVGLENRTFKVHRAMLTEVAAYFNSMFSAGFKEAVEGSASFPEYDGEAWELLIQWSYHGKLPPLHAPKIGAALTAKIMHLCTIRLKLCCLAEKYGMSLLQNLAMDSIIDHLKQCGPVIRIHWEVLKDWFCYTYQSTHEKSAIRLFMSYYFYYALTSQKEDTPNLAAYNLDDMHELLSRLPDLNKDSSITFIGLRFDWRMRRRGSVHGQYKNASSASISGVLSSTVRRASLAGA